jgi:RNA polymerase II elongation factor ELL
LDDREIKIPKSSDLPDYDLYRSNSDKPSVVNKLPNPTMSILRFSNAKPKTKTLKAQAPAAKGAKPTKTVIERSSAKASVPVARSSAGSDRELGSQESLDDAIANLKSSYAKVEADKRENSYASLNGAAEEGGTNMAIVLWSWAACSALKVEKSKPANDCSRHKQLPPRLDL